MINVNRYSLLIILLLIFNSCIFDFDPPSKDYENLLVVEAMLQNSEEPFIVKLSRSIPIDTAGLIPETGALVSIADNTGNIEYLTEYSHGQYTSAPSFRAQIGRIYQLHIQTTKGSRYESDSVLLRETPSIDSIYYKYEERVTLASVAKIPGL